MASPTPLCSAALDAPPRFALRSPGRCRAALVGAGLGLPAVGSPGPRPVAGRHRPAGLAAAGRAVAAGRCRQPRRPDHRGANRGQPRHRGLEASQTRHPGRPDLRSAGDRGGRPHAASLAEVRRRPSEISADARGRGRDLPGGRAADAPLREVRRQSLGHQPHAQEEERDRRRRLDGSVRRRGGPPPDRVVLPREGLRLGPRDDRRGEQAGRQGGRVPHRRGAATQGALDQLRGQHDRQRCPAAHADQVEARHLLDHWRRHRPRGGRSGRGGAHGLLPQPRLLSGEGEPRGGGGARRQS